MYDEEDDIPECPLCLDPLELDDVSFFPCTCGYQVCRFCWHRIRTDENGLCPQCRKPYSEDPVRFKPLSNEEIQKMKKDRDRRAKEKKGNALDSRKHLANLRVVQPNLLFVVGLTQRMADAELLKRTDYFGRFGKINKLSVTVTTPAGSANSANGTSGSVSSQQQPPRFSATCHVTYAKAEEALRALLFLDQSQLDSRTLRISIGTTKYCSNFVKGNACHRKDCTYLHEVGPSDASFTKEAMQDGKHVEYERRLLLDFVARNPHLAQQVDISKINNKTLPSAAGNSTETATAQLQPLLNENGGNSNGSSNSGNNGNSSSHLRHHHAAGATSAAATSSSSQINGASKAGQTSSSKQRSAGGGGGTQPQSGSTRRAGAATAAAAVTSSSSGSTANGAFTATNGSSSSTTRGRSGSASGSGKQRSGKGVSKSKDDASIVSAAANQQPQQPAQQPQQQQPRHARSKNNVATSIAPSKGGKQPSDPSAVVPGVRPSLSTSSVLKGAASSTTTSTSSSNRLQQQSVRTSRLTTPDEPVWWGLDPDEDLSSCTSTSPTDANGVIELNGKLSPSDAAVIKSHHRHGVVTSSDPGIGSSVQSLPMPLLPGSSAPSPLLTHGDSGFVSSSSSTGGSEPSSSTSNHSGNGTLVSLFSSSALSSSSQACLMNGNGSEMPFSSAASTLAHVDRAIAAILLPSPDRSSSSVQHHQQSVGMGQHHPQQQQQAHHNIPSSSSSAAAPMQPGRPIDLKDILRSCAGLALPTSPTPSSQQALPQSHSLSSSTNGSMMPSSSMNNNNIDCCEDDLDVDPMEESIRRLNDLMAAEQRKKAALSTSNANNIPYSSPGYSLFQHHGAIGEPPKSASSSSSHGYGMHQQQQPVQNGYNTSTAAIANSRLLSQVLASASSSSSSASVHSSSSTTSGYPPSLFAAAYNQSGAMSLSNGPQQPLQSTNVGSSQSHFVNGNSSWPSFSNYSDGSSYSQQSSQQQQRNGYIGSNNGGGGFSSASNDSSNLSNWLVPQIQQQQQQQHQQQQSQQQQLNGGMVGGNNYHQHHYHQGSMQPTSGAPTMPRSTANDYLATVMAAAGKRL